MPLSEKIDQYELSSKVDISEEEKQEAREKAKVFEIAERDLSEQVEEQAGMYSYISTLCATQRANRNKAKLEEKIAKSQCRLNLRQNPPPGKWLADDFVSMVETDPIVLQACADHIYQQRLLDHLEADQEASRQKGDMLKLLALSLKQEQMLKTGY